MKQRRGGHHQRLQGRAGGRVRVAEDGLQGLERLGDPAAVQQQASQDGGELGAAARVSKHRLDMLEYCLGPRRKVQRPVQIEGPGDGDLKALLIGPGGRCQGSKDQLSVFRAALAEQRETNHTLGFHLAASSRGCPGQALGETEIEHGHGQPGRGRQLPRC